MRYFLSKFHKKKTFVYKFIYIKESLIGVLKTKIIS